MHSNWHSFLRGSLFISVIQMGWGPESGSRSLSSKVFPTRSLLRPPPPWDWEPPTVSAGYFGYRIKPAVSWWPPWPVPFLTVSPRVLFPFRCWRSRIRHLCTTWPLSVFHHLVGIYRLPVLHSALVWRPVWPGLAPFLLCVCRAWLPSYLWGDPVRTGVWRGETEEKLEFLLGVVTELRAIYCVSASTILSWSFLTVFHFCFCLKSTVTTWTRESVG